MPGCRCSLLFLPPKRRLGEGDFSGSSVVLSLPTLVQVGVRTLGEKTKVMRGAFACRGWWRCPTIPDSETLTPTKSAQRPLHPPGGELAPHGLALGPERS